MEQAEQETFGSKLKRVFWPIENFENKKFIPMALMMACILFNYSVLRSLKDGMVVANIGAEAISFLKTYVVLPLAILFIILYTKLCNIMNAQKVFYTVTSIFIGYFTFFSFVIYPNTEFFHASTESIESLAAEMPRLKWFIRIGGKWGYGSFYLMAEMWGSMMISLLFWQFANQITKTAEAKRFYSMFGLLGNVPLLFIPYIFGKFLTEENSGSGLFPVLCITIVSGVLILMLYAWINKNVLTDSRLYDPAAIGGKKKKKKAKLSVSESFKMIMSSKYLGLIAMLVLSYGVSINLVEGVWKSKVKLMYPGEVAYTKFMGDFMFWQGLVAIFFMLVGANILRMVSWSVAAIFTPLMILATGAAFFSFIIFESSFGLQVAAFLGTGPLAMIVVIGMMQNVLSKGVKYSLFDSTKEMSYIPLDDEMKTKGKAAVDVIGGRLGKAGGALIQSTAFLISGGGFKESTPYFAVFFFAIVVLWIYSVQVLGKEYKNKLEENERAKASEGEEE